MKKTLYLMRHGQTQFNLEHKIQGWYDSPLTPLGIYQAKMAGKYLKDQHISFDHAYSSTSERASDALEIVTDYKMSYTRLKGLKEWHFGAFEGKDEYLNTPMPYGDFFVRYGGEGEAQVQKRMVETLTEIMEKENHQMVLVVSHGGACGQFYLAMEKYAQFQLREKFYNCCILKFSYENGIFVLEDIYNRHITSIDEKGDC